MAITSKIRVTEWNTVTERRKRHNVLIRGNVKDVNGTDRMVYVSTYMESPNGKLWRVDISNTGVISTTDVSP